MKKSSQTILIGVLIIGLVVSPIQAQILGDAICRACARIYINSGCVNNPTLLCRLLELKFSTVIGGSRICNQFYCTSRSQHTCLAECTTGWEDEEDGLCNPGFVCCSPSDTRAVA